jgi:hypothetical protein
LDRIGDSRAVVTDKRDKPSGRQEINRAHKGIETSRKEADGLDLVKCGLLVWSVFPISRATPEFPSVAGEKPECPLDVLRVLGPKI